VGRSNEALMSFIAVKFAVVEWNFCFAKVKLHLRRSEMFPSETFRKTNFLKITLFSNDRCEPVRAEQGLAGATMML
jgi:hypothetical protein